MSKSGTIAGIDSVTGNVIWRRHLPHTWRHERTLFKIHTIRLVRKTHLSLPPLISVLAEFTDANQTVIKKSLTVI